MNTAIPYGLGFAVLALLLWRCGRPREAEGVATMTLGLVAFAPWVAWSPYWPLAGVTIWSITAIRLHVLADRRYFSVKIPIIGYAMAAGYMAHMVDRPLTLPPVMAHWQSWTLNFMGVCMVALIAGRPARDLYRSAVYRIARMARGRALRCLFGGGLGGDQVGASRRAPPKTRAG